MIYRDTTYHLSIHSTDKRFSGLIFSITILIAAGFAVYDNPQVRHWVDESRRKIAIALHSLGDEIQPPRDSRSRRADASTREDESSEAAERRRKAREEILERARVMEERRRSKAGEKVRGMSFNDLVDDEGMLKQEAQTAAHSTAAETATEDEGLRRRNTEAKAAAMGSATADPFADEMHMDFHTEDSPAQTDPPAQESRESTTTLLGVPRSESLPPQSQQPSMLIDTEAASNHPSEFLVDLTPTTSASSAHNDLAELNNNAHQQITYYSVNEWAENSSTSFYSPPQSEAGRTEDLAAESSAGTGEHVGNMSDVDMVSEIGEGTNTPGSWMEVGSVVSEED